MANFTKTISNSLNLFGGSPTSLWQAWNWNAFKWGEGTADLAVAAMHVISESLSLDSLVYDRSVVFVLSNTLSMDSDMNESYLTDGSGYSYLFPSDVTNHEDQSIASYVSGSRPSNSWSSGSVGASTWQ